MGLPVSSTGLLNMKPHIASRLAIFIAARLRKKAPRIVSKGLDLVLAFINSSPSSLSKTVFAERTLDKASLSQYLSSSDISIFLSSSNIHELNVSEDGTGRLWGSIQETFS